MQQRVHMTWCSLCGQRRIKKKNHIIIYVRLETAGKCSCISRPPDANKKEEVPEAAANIMLEIVENSQSEVSNGGKKR